MASTNNVSTLYKNILELDFIIQDTTKANEVSVNFGYLR